MCLNESGMVTTERVAELLGLAEDQARAEMRPFVVAAWCYPSRPVPRSARPAASSAWFTGCVTG